MIEATVLCTSQSEQNISIYIRLEYNVVLVGLQKSILLVLVLVFFRDNILSLVLQQRIIISVFMFVHIMIIHAPL